jgi:hypothetical protein
MVADYLTLFDEILASRLHRPQTSPRTSPPPDEPQPASSQPGR